MRSMYVTAVLAALLGFSSGAGANAQLPAGSAASTDGFPIDVTAKPATVQPGGVVTIRGTTVASPNGANPKNPATGISKSLNDPTHGTV